MKIVEDIENGFEGEEEGMLTKVQSVKRNRTQNEAVIYINIWNKPLLSSHEDKGRERGGSFCLTRFYYYKFTITIASTCLQELGFLVWSRKGWKDRCRITIPGICCLHEIQELTQLFFPHFNILSWRRRKKKQCSKHTSQERMTKWSGLYCRLQ